MNSCKECLETRSVSGLGITVGSISTLTTMLAQGANSNQQEEDTRVTFRVTPGIMIMAIVTGACMALGSGAVNKYIFRK